VIVVVHSNRQGFGGGASRKDRWFLSGIGLISFLVLVGVGFLLLGRPAAIPADPRGSPLPALNAFLNGTAAGLLAVGYLLIRRKQVSAHKRCMVTAFGFSCLFLFSYLVHHIQVGSVPFAGRGWIRPLYFALLVSHIGLAALILPLSLLTLYRALTEQFEKHMRVARWTLPIWLYVSVTGVIVYLMLYQLYPPK
jgi:uncharacterized membrane protein YozB (DUF420 family)